MKSVVLPTPKSGVRKVGKVGKMTRAEPKPHHPHLPLLGSGVVVGVNECHGYTAVLTGEPIDKFRWLYGSIRISLIVLIGLLTDQLIA